MKGLRRVYLENGKTFVGQGNKKKEVKADLLYMGKISFSHIVDKAGIPHRPKKKYNQVIKECAPKEANAYCFNGWDIKPAKDNPPRYTHSCTILYLKIWIPYS